MEKSPKVIYKKTLDNSQILFEQKLLLKIKEQVPTKSGRKRPIKFPQYISFSLMEDKTLLMYIQEQKRKNEILNATCQNMQSDNAAFEGWAICLKAWLPNEINKVVLKWDAPDEKTRKKGEGHYNRFLFRCLKFREHYDWFSIAPSNESCIAKFKQEYTNLSVNTSNKEPEKKTNNENAVEYEFADVKASMNRDILMNYYHVTTFNHQLHVGVKKSQKQLFTGGQSAIDLWGIDAETLTVIELKYIDDKKSAKNIKVGIISELFLYSCIMEDLVRGIITPDKPILKDEILLYQNITSLKKIHAEMLSNEYHPLVDNENVFTILNNNNDTNGVKTIYRKTIYDYKRGSYNLRIL